MKQTPLSELTFARFAAQLNQSFHVLGHPGASVDLQLRQADLHPANSSATSSAESFSIVFRGPLVPLLPQGTYTFANAALGAFDLFIVPVRKDREGVYYEAVFNRLV